MNYKLCTILTNSWNHWSTSVSTSHRSPGNTQPILSSSSRSSTPHQQRTSWSSRSFLVSSKSSSCSAVQTAISRRSLGLNGLSQTLIPLFLYDKIINLCHGSNFALVHDHPESTTLRASHHGGINASDYDKTKTASTAHNLEMQTADETGNNCETKPNGPATRKPCKHTTTTRLPTREPFRNVSQKTNMLRNMFLRHVTCCKTHFRKTKMLRNESTRHMNHRNVYFRRTRNCKINWRETWNNANYFFPWKCFL